MQSIRPLEVIIMVRNMTEGNPLKHIILFALPIFAGNIFQQIYNFADAAIVGRFVSADALASVGASGSTVFLLISLLMGLTTGASIVISQSFGRGNYADMRSAVSSLYIIVSALSLVIGAAGFVLCTPLLRLLNTPAPILADASLYLKILFCGVPAMALYNSGSAILRSLGNSSAPLVMLIVSSLVNIGLDLALIIYGGLGVCGAAYATVASQLICAVMCSAYIYIKRRELMLGGARFSLDTSMIKRIFKMGVPSALQSSLIALGGMSVQSLVNSFGEMTMAAYTAANKIDSIAIQFVVSIGMAVSVFSGQNIGAGRIDRIKSCLKSALTVQIIMCCAIAAVIVCTRKLLLGMFLDEAAAEAIETGSRYISIICVAYVISGIMQSFLNVLRGTGDVNFSMIAGIVELTVRIIFAYLLSYLMQSSTGIWIATPIAWGSACVVTVLRYRSSRWTAAGAKSA